MKTFISLALCASTLAIAISCKEMQEKEMTEDIKANSKEFYDSGIHFTVTSGCPLTTKSSKTDTKSFTITGTLDEKTATMYVVDKKRIQGSLFPKYTFKMGQKFQHLLSTMTKLFVMRFLLS